MYYEFEGISLYFILDSKTIISWDGSKRSSAKALKFEEKCPIYKASVNLL